MDELNAVVTQVVQVSPIMKVFRVSPDGWELPDFTPGQFVALFLPPTAARAPEATEEPFKANPDKMIKRAYSIASSSKAKDFLEFYVTLVHSGNLTPRLFNLQIGDRIGVGKRFVGMFTLKEIPEEKNIVLIATGTGVAPYMSMLRTDALQRKGKLAVIHGASNSWDLGYSSELNLLENIAPGFTYIPTITFPEKEHTPWNGYTKFIQDMWKDGIMEEKWGFKPTPENTSVFLCGNPRMINDMVEAMAVDGFTEHKKKSPGQIHVEKF
jgi:ferredoxin--NADP+ reductase